MRALALELNDAALCVARPGEILASEPAEVAAGPEGLCFGEPARRVSRLSPQRANDRYWSELSQEPLPRALPGAKTAADLVHAQLAQLWDRHRGDAEGAVLVVPGGLGRQKLSLLLGIAEASGIPVRGLVDAAVAASTRDYPGWESVHVELGLHAVGLTRLQRLAAGEAGATGPAVAARSYESVCPLGLSALRERWARRIAAAFVAQTRFDPLSDGGHEQRLFDALPGWLETLAAESAASLELEAAGTTRRARVSRAELVATGAEVYEPVARRLAALREAGGGLAVRVGPVLAALPGLIEGLATIPGLRVVRLAPGAGALGALARIDAASSPAGRLALVTRLPWSEPPGELPALGPDEHAGSEPATHLVVRGVAHPIGEPGLGLRVGAAGELFVQGGEAARRCEAVLRRGERGVVLRCAASLPLLRNGDAPGAEEVLLAPGDRLSVRGSAHEAQLVRVLDGA